MRKITSQELENVVAGTNLFNNFMSSKNLKIDCSNIDLKPKFEKRYFIDVDNTLEFRILKDLF